MTGSVELPHDVMALVRQEAKLRGCSEAALVCWWLRIGWASEHFGEDGRSLIAEALDGLIDTARLHPADDERWLDAFVDKMGRPSAAELAFYKERRSLGRGVGLDVDGNLIFAGGGADG